jgi:hypothetical protein
MFYHESLAKTLVVAEHVQEATQTAVANAYLKEENSEKSIKILNMLAFAQ